MPDLNTEALEAAARAIWSVSFENARDDNAWEAIAEETRVGVREEARRAITAYLAARAEQGFREMPREPTREMVKAAGAQAMKINPAEDDDWRAVAFDSLSIYRAMFDAKTHGGEG